MADCLHIRCEPYGDCQFAPAEASPETPGEPGATRLSCPLCNWHLDVTPPQISANTLASVFGPGVMASVALAEHMQDTEDKLGEHLRTHGPEEWLPEITRLRDELGHAKSALAGDHEGVRLWMLDCSNLVAKHRERAERAEVASPERMLREFHASKRIHGGLMPEVPTADAPDWVRSLRWSLLSEELRELGEADTAGDVVKIADAIADITYVLVGTAVVHGIPFDAVFAEVHRSNMTKVNTPEEAKLVKGPDYEPPRIAEILGVHPCPEHRGEWQPE